MDLDWYHGVAMSTKRKPPVTNPPSIISCDGKPVEVNKIADKDYRRALVIGLTAMLKSGEIDYATIKPD